jgi:hypothetical protein
VRQFALDALLHSIGLARPVRPIVQWNAALKKNPSNSPSSPVGPVVVRAQTEARGRFSAPQEIEAESDALSVNRRADSLADAGGLALLSRFAHYRVVLIVFE